MNGIDDFVEPVADERALNPDGAADRPAMPDHAGFRSRRRRRASPMDTTLKLPAQLQATVDEAIARAIETAHPGDTVVVMSNGRFADAPDRILLGTGYPSKVPTTSMT